MEKLTLDRSGFKSILKKNEKSASYFSKQGSSVFHIIALILFIVASLATIVFIISLFIDETSTGGVQLLGAIGILLILWTCYAIFSCAACLVDNSYYSGIYLEKIYRKLNEKSDD